MRRSIFAPKSRFENFSVERVFKAIPYKDGVKAVDAYSESRRASLNAWFTNTLVSRLDNKEKGAIVVVMQRVHLDDLSGHLMDSSDQWDVLSLAAIAEEDEHIPLGGGRIHFRKAGEALHPERESLETIRGLQQTLDPKSTPPKCNRPLSLQAEA